MSGTYIIGWQKLDHNGNVENSPQWNKSFVRKHFCELAIKTVPCALAPSPKHKVSAISQFCLYTKFAMMRLQATLQTQRSL